MQFIATSSGFINLAHVLLIRVGVEREEGEDLIQLSDGRTIQCVIHDRSFLPGIEPKPLILTPDNRQESPERGFGEPAV